MRRNALLQLLAQNRQPPRPMASRIVRNSDAEATVYLYDQIVGDRLSAEWYGGVCPQDFVPALHAIDAQTIHLRINSPGGDVFGSEAMAQAMREHPAQIVGHIDGLAASAATNIACACDRVEMARNAKYMVHQAWTIGMGNADDLRQTADLLDKVDASIIAEYARYTGKDAETVAAWVKAETWFAAEEALAAGFVHAIAGEAQPTNSSAWNLSAYANAPKPPPTASDEHRDRQRQRMRALSALHRIE